MKLFLLLPLIPDIYIWFYFLRGLPVWMQAVWYVPLLSVLLLTVCLLTPYSAPWMFRALSMLLLLCYVPKILFMLPSVAGLLFRGLSPVVWKIGSGIGICAACLTVVVALYGMTYGWKRLEIREKTVYLENLPPSFCGYRIAHISDLHIGTCYGDTQYVAKVIDATNALRADMICFTGDLVNSSPEELKPYTHILKRLHAPDGVFSVMGNHDYCMYQHHSSQREQLKAAKQVEKAQRDMGWRLLMNENAVVTRGGDSIAIVGVENAGKAPFPDRSNLSQALASSAGVTLPSFKILLSHDPTHWQREVLPKTDIALQLSGHTHATQFKVFGICPAKYIYKEYNGLYEYDGVSSYSVDSGGSPSLRKLFVNTGVGANVAFRFGAWPEICVLTLRRAEK